MKDNMIVLASSSPRRIDIMREHGIEPLIIKPECKEDLPPDISGSDAVMFLSLKKALSVEEKIISGISIPLYAECMEKGAYIIAADTVVYKDDMGILGKPENRDDAYYMLKKLSGKEHSVLTGVSILRCGRPERRTFYEETKVTFKEYGDKEILEYIDTDEPYDKAGGYAIQGVFGKYVDRFAGDLDNVIGFPWERIIKEFKYIQGK